MSDPQQANSLQEGSAIAALLASRIGLNANSLGRMGLAKPVEQAMARLGFTDSELFLRHLKTSTRALDALIDSVVIPETSFFRNPESFVYLRDYIEAAEKAQPQKRSQKRRWRVLSLPCSTGEEPYSIAITLLEAGLPAGSFHIDGVDISKQALASARQGSFAPYSFRKTVSYSPDQHIQRYFQLSQRRYQMVDQLRSHVQFHQGNLAEPNCLQGQAPYDIIFCRNLLIYFHQKARDRALQKLDRLLVPNGLLFVGYAEASQIDLQRFKSVSRPQAFVYQKLATPTMHNTMHNGATHLGARPVDSPQPTVSIQQMATDSISLETIREFMEKGQLEPALAQCDHYLQNEPVSAAAHLLLGEIYQAKGQYACADSAFQKVLYLDPSCTEALIYRVEMAEQAGDRAVTQRLLRRLERRLNQQRL
ncbi:MAG: CheR family methyltransferase [Cyanobacteria bacterium P01_F01_bin.53]